MECSLCHQSYVTKAKLSLHVNGVHRRKKLRPSSAEELENVRELFDILPEIAGSVVLNPLGFCGDALQTVLEWKGGCKVYTNGPFGAGFRVGYQRSSFTHLVRRVKPMFVVCYNELPVEAMRVVIRSKVKMVILRVNDVAQFMHLKPSRTIPLKGGQWMVWER